MVFRITEVTIIFLDLSVKNKTSFSIKNIDFVLYKLKVSPIIFNYFKYLLNNTLKQRCSKP